MSSLRINNKGLSQIVAIVFFILLSIISATLLYSSVRIWLDKPQETLSPFVSCVEILKIPPEIEKSIYNKETNNIEVTIKRHPADDYTNSFEFILKSDSEASIFNCGPSCGGSCNLQNPGESKTFFFLVDKENIPQETTLLVNKNCEIGTKEIEI